MKRKLKIIVSIIAISLSSSVFATDTLEVELVNGKEYISLNQRNLVILFNATNEQFDSIAMAFGFKILSEKDGVVDYILGPMTEKWQVIGKSGFFVTISWFDMKGTNRLTTSLRKSVEGMPYSTEGKTEYYFLIINNRKYKLGISKESEYVFEDVTFGLAPGHYPKE